jgi:hypothetical protein
VGDQTGEAVDPKMEVDRQGEVGLYCQEEADLDLWVGAEVGNRTGEAADSSKMEDEADSIPEDMVDLLAVDEVVVVL